MSDILQKACEMLAEKFAGSGFDQSAKFVINDEGALLINGENVTIGDGEADVTLKADLDTFKGMMSGDVSGQAAFMTGQLEIEGDMSLAMQLGAMLS